MSTSVSHPQVPATAPTSVSHPLVLSTNVSSVSPSPISSPASGNQTAITSAQPQWRFPMLTNKGMPSDEFERLKGRLQHESIEISRQFGRTVSNFFRSLHDQDIPIKKIVVALKAFGAFSRLDGDENQPLLRDELKSLDLAKADIDDIELIVLDYCSFFTFKLLSDLVSQLGTPNDKEQFEEYEKEFTVYAQRRIFECPSEFSEMDGTKTNLVMKIDHHYCNSESKLTQLRVLEIDLCQIFNITHLKLCQVTKGCLQLIFQIPPFVQEKVFPLTHEQEDKLVNLHVLSVVCGDYHFTSEGHELSSDVEKTEQKTNTEEEKWQIERTQIQNQIHVHTELKRLFGDEMTKLQDETERWLDEKMYLLTERVYNIEMEHLQTEMKQQQGKIEHLRAELAQLHIEMKQLETEMKELDTKRKQWQGEMEKLETKRKQWQGEMVQSKVTRSEQEQKLLQIQMKRMYHFDKKQQLIEIKQSQIEVKQLQIKTKQRQIEAMKQRQTEMKEEFEKQHRKQLHGQQVQQLESPISKKLRPIALQQRKTEMEPIPKEYETKQQTFHGNQLYGQQVHKQKQQFETKLEQSELLKFQPRSSSQ